MLRGVIFLFLVFLIITVPVSVYAIGSSTNDDEVFTSSCSEKSSRKARIECRLEEVKKGNFDEAEGFTGYTVENPEACKELEETSTEEKTSISECTLLYQRLIPCYTLSKRPKVECFRDTSGLTTSPLSTQSADQKEIGHYIVSLLYEIQNRIEDRHASGDISTEKAAEAVDLIVDIKEKIMNGKSKSSIKSGIKGLKSII